MSTRAASRNKHVEAWQRGTALDPRQVARATEVMRRRVERQREACRRV